MCLIENSAVECCVCFVQDTGDMELLNYSEHGSLVDGVLYSCDISDKDPAPKEQPIPLTLDDILAMGKGRRAAKSRAKLEAARRTLKDKQKAKMALEGALRLTVPSSTDDALLAEELSKSEGLMTRTGLKRVSIESHNLSVVSIPLSKARKVEVPGNAIKKDCEQKTKPPKITAEKSKSVSNSANKTSPTKALRNHTKLNSPCHKQLPTRPCLCDKDRAESSERAEEERLEGTALLAHGSRLRFGCLEFVLSVAGCSGHSELLTALTEDT